MLLAGIWIKVVSPGPLLFKQQRVGRDGKTFAIFKLRTMNVEQETSNVTKRNDARLFAGADLLRALKIDELPQLVNILEGQMSLVGPRPTTADDYERMTSRQKARWLAIPGMTGKAQVSGNTALTWPERIEHDLDYVRNASLKYDCTVILKTGMLLLTGRAASHPAGDDEWKRNS